MSKELVLDKLYQIISAYTCIAKPDSNSDMMAKPLSFRPHEMAAFFLEIEKEFAIDLNELMPKLKLFSLKAIAEEIFELLSSHVVTE